MVAGFKNAESNDLMGKNDHTQRKHRKLLVLHIPRLKGETVWTDLSLHKFFGERSKRSTAVGDLVLLT